MVQEWVAFECLSYRKISVALIFFIMDRSHDECMIAKEIAFAAKKNSVNAIQPYIYDLNYILFKRVVAK
jgi:hypothetical protein